MDEMVVAQMNGLHSIAQLFHTSKLSNEDYQVIMLAHFEDMEAIREKSANEATNEGNVNAWLSHSKTVTLEDVLHELRQEYLTSLGSNFKALSPPALYDALNEVYKSNIKHLHQLGKGIQHVVGAIRRR